MTIGRVLWSRIRGIGGTDGFILPKSLSAIEKTDNAAHSRLAEIEMSR